MNTAFWMSKAGIVAIIAVAAIVITCVCCGGLLGLSLINPTP